MTKKCPTVYLLLMLTIVFAVLTFLVQLFFIDSNTTQREVNKMLFKSDSMRHWEESKRINAISRIDYDYEKCKRLFEKNLELKDLRRMKNSYLNELKQMERKQKVHLKRIIQLEAQIEEFKSILDKLQYKSTYLKHVLLADLFRVNSLDMQVDKHEFDQAPRRLISNNVHFNLTGQVNRCTYETCFDYIPACASQRLELFIYNAQHSKVKSIFAEFDMDLIGRSVSVRSTPANSCLVVVFMLEDEPGYYRALSRFLIANINNRFNYVLVDMSNESYFRKVLIEQVDSVEEKKLLGDQLDRAILSSFDRDQDFQADFHIHFSILNRSDYLNELNNKEIAIKNYTNDRQYLLGYFGYLINHLPIEQLFIKHKTIDLATNCSLNERLERLADSKFTLFVQSRIHWSRENTFHLIEALKCASIPVLIGMDLKLPLSDLIVWNEVAIRIPLARMLDSIQILTEIPDNELTARQIKATNIYKHYFSSSTQMFRTLIAAIQFNLHLPISPVEEFRGDEFKFGKLMLNNKTLNKKTEMASEKLFKSSEYDLNEAADENGIYFDSDIEENYDDSEYLGPSNQKPILSLSFRHNLTRSSYLMWNKYYYPFSMFPATPFESNPSIQNVYYNIRNDYSIPIAAKVQDEEDMIRYSEYIMLTNNTLGGGDGKFFNHMLSGSYAEEQFTIVILSFKREKILLNLVENYLKLPYLNLIIIVWNWVEQAPSVEFEQKFHFYFSTGRVRIVKSKVNSLNNRFLPFEFIKTDAVLSMDDDMMLRADEILFAFRVWRENRQRIVGFPARYHSWNFIDKNFAYKSDLSCEVSYSN